MEAGVSADVNTATQRWWVVGEDWELFICTNLCSFLGVFLVGFKWANQTYNSNSVSHDYLIFVAAQNKAMQHNVFL